MASSRLWWIVVLPVALLLGPAPTESSAATTRLEGEAPLHFPTQEQSWQLRLVAEHEGSDDDAPVRARLEVRRADGTTALKESVPAWATPPGFTLDADIVEHDDVTLLLAEIRPSSAHEGPEKITLQFAWRLEHRRTDASGFAATELIERQQYSELDGGSLLEFRDTDQSAQTPRRLVRRSASSTTHFCSGPEEPLRVYDAYDVDTDSFERVVAIDDLVASAETLKPRLPADPFAGPFTQGVFQWYWASSKYLEEGESTDSTLAIRPVAMGDGLFETAWTVDARKQLRGTYATASITPALPVAGLRIVPGVPRPESKWDRHGRPRRLLVTAADGSSFVFEVPESGRESLAEKRGFVVEFPRQLDTTCLTVVYLGEHAGGTEGRVSMAEVTPLTPVDAGSAAETARRLVDRISNEEDGRHRRRLSYIGAGLGQDLADAIEAALSEFSGAKRRRIVPLVRHLPSQKSVEILSEFFRKMDRDAVEFREIKRGLAAQRGAAAESLAKMLDDFTVNDPKYVDIVRLLGRVGSSEDLRKLIADLGAGASTARGARVRAIASGGPSLLRPLFETLKVDGSVDVTADALRIIFLIGRRANVGSIELPENSNRLLTLLENSEKRRLLMAGLKASHHLPMPEVVDVIDARLADHSDALVRKAAMDALEFRSGDDARRLLEAGLEDASPDVRIAAITALGDRKDPGGSREALFEYADRETWTPGLKQAFAVLATIPGQKTDEYFMELVRSEDRRKAEMAVTALVRADRTVGDDLAMKLAEKSEASPAVRRKAIDMLGLGDSEAGREYLLALVARDDNSDPPAGELQSTLRNRALLSLGRRGSDVGRMRLVQIAREGDDLEARQHAIRALAFYRNAELASLLKSWKADAPPELRSTIRQTVQIIENRGSIEEVGDELDSLIKDIE